MQNGLFAADDQRMTGVMSALEARHRVRAVGEQVNDFALAFVAPLRSDYDYVLCHWLISFRNLESPVNPVKHGPHLSLRVLSGVCLELQQVRFFQLSSVCSS
jgi:hypothetical protein